MAKMCRRLSAVERVRIELELRDGLSLTRIAEAIGRPKGTVSKEIARHGGGGAYAADAIQSVGVLRGGRPNRAWIAERSADHSPELSVLSGRRLRLTQRARTLFLCNAADPMLEAHPRHSIRWYNHDALIHCFYGTFRPDGIIGSPSR